MDTRPHTLLNDRLRFPWRRPLRETPTEAQIGQRRAAFEQIVKRYEADLLRAARGSMAAGPGRPALTDERRAAMEDAWAEVDAKRR